MRKTYRELEIKSAVEMLRRKHIAKYPSVFEELKFTTMTTSQDFDDWMECPPDATEIINVTLKAYRATKDVFDTHCEYELRKLNFLGAPGDTEEFWQLRTQVRESRKLNFFGAPEDTEKFYLGNVSEDVANALGAEWGRQYTIAEMMVKYIEALHKIIQTTGIPTASDNKKKPTAPDDFKDDPVELI